MSDAAPAIFNGFSEHYPEMKNGMCYFHVMKNLKERRYTSDKTKNEFLHDIRSLSKSHSQEHFDASVVLFLAKYESEKDVLLLSAVSHLKKVWLIESNRGWHSGVVPATVTTNNGLEVTNRIFKKNFKGEVLLQFRYSFHFMLLIIFLSIISR
jgi:transposase-like protein